MTMIQVFKKEMDESFKEICENTNKMLDKINTTGQDLKVRRKSIKKTKTEINLEIKHFWNQIVNSEASPITRKWEIKGRMSAIVTIENTGCTGQIKLQI